MSNIIKKLILNTRKMLVGSRLERRILIALTSMIVIVSIVPINNLSNKIEKEFKITIHNGLMVDTKINSERLINKLRAKEILLNEISEHFEFNGELSDTAYNKKYLEFMSKKNNETLFIGHSDGSYEVGTNGEAPDDFDVTTRDWYTEALKSDKTIHTSLYDDAITGEKMFTIAQHIGNGDVIGIDILLEDIVSVIRNDIAEYSGYFIINDSAGNIIYKSENTDNDEAIEVTKLKDDESIMDYLSTNEKNDYIGLEGKVGNVYLDGREHLLYTYEIYNNWDVSFISHLDEVSAKSKEIVNHVILVYFVILLLVYTALKVMLRLLVKPIICMSESTEIMRNKDYTKVIDISSKDEVGLLGKSLNNLRVDVASLISGSSEVVEDVFNSSQRMGSLLADINTSSDDVENASREISYAIQNQTKEVVDISNFADLLRDGMQDINDSVEISKMSIDKNKEYSLIVNNTLDEVLEQTGINTEILSSINSRFTSLQDSASKIMSISNVIKEISENTKLLALNASIEASRVGEAGRGFEVVAKEVGGLAESSAQSNHSIQKLLSDVVSTIGLIGDEIIELVKYTDMQNMSILDTKNNYDVMNNAIDILSGNIVTISEKTVVVNNEANDIVEKLNSLSALSEEISAVIENVHTTIENQSLKTREIEGISRNQVAICDKLDSMVQEYNV